MARADWLDLTGHKYGMLTVVEHAEPGTRHSKWRCRCECGGEIVRTGGDLRRTRSPTRHCGCIPHPGAKPRHGHSTDAGHSPTYGSWVAMKGRCYRPADPKFGLYGGRGIQVCDRWLDSFDNFLADMGVRPDRHTLDRKDSNGDYTPDNCRWATYRDQSINRRNTYLVDGVSLHEFARVNDVSYNVLSDRVKRLGINPHAAVAALRSAGSRFREVSRRQTRCVPSASGAV